MRVLVKIHPIDRAETDNPNEVAAMAFSSVSSQYETEASISDSYLYKPDDPDNFAEEVNLVDGTTNPDEIKSIAKSWNDHIQDNFDKCLRAMSASPQDLDGTVQYLMAAHDTIYEMKKAAIALDNSFYDFAEDLLLIVPEGYFTTIIPPNQMAEIEANPENYVKIDVTAK